MLHLRIPAVASFLVLIISGCSKNNSTSNSVVIPGNPVGGEVLTNVVYGSNTDWQGNTVSLDMDIYFPPNRIAGYKYPTVMLMHAGSFYAGKKEGIAGKCRILADSGYIAATINYRLGWDHALNCEGDTVSLLKASYRAFQDANAAMRFLVSNSDEYGIDTAWLFEGGLSAGAVIALNINYLTDEIVQTKNPEVTDELGGLNNSSNNLTNTYTIKGILSIAGALPDSTLINSTNAKPTIFFQGDADEVIPVDTGTYKWCPNYNKLYGSLCLYRRLTANSTLAIAHILHGSGHENSENSGYDDTFTMTNTACFFHKLINKEAQSSKIYYDYQYNCQ